MATKATACIRRGEAGESNVRIPIVAMTANASEEDRQRCLDAGMDEYVAKPIVQRELWQATRRVLGIGGAEERVA